MKSKVVYIMAVIGVLSMTQAFAERKHYEISSRDGKEGEESSLCKDVLDGAAKLPACAAKDEEGEPKSIEIDKGCSSHFYQEHPGDNDLKVNVKAAAAWSCDTK